MSGDRAPERPLKLRSRYSRLGREKRDRGNEPVRRLELRSRCCNVEIVKSCGDIVPERLRLGRERKMTWLFVLH